ncbi:MAG: NAD+ synthase [Desulfopila sp.]
MRISLVQINPIIGDFDGNCKKIQRFAEEAQRDGCQLVIFPELAISGYPPQDLLERTSFLAAHDQAMAKLVACLPPVDVMFGCVERCEDEGGKPLFNSAVVARDGEIVFRARKRLLPSYDVFDEIRYFEPGPAAELYQAGELTFGVTVCEDVWHYAVHEYDVIPVEDLHRLAERRGKRLAGMINISASPYQRQKEDLRKSIFSRYCRQFATPFLYCNQVGGQDSLIFDGRSLVMDEKGRVVAQAPGFVEDRIVVDTDTWQGEMHGPVDPPVIETVYQGLVCGVGDYVRKCGFSQVVVGLSGGIDSALTAAIAVAALGAENVLGVAMPSPYSSKASVEDAERLAINLGCRFEVIPIGEIFALFRTSLAPLFRGREEDLAEQNLQARIRGNLLMALSNKLGHLLLTTGNKSEMAVGYCTLYGDMSGGLAVISDVPKQLVYELSRYVNREKELIPRRTLEKPPSAELKPDQLDQDDLPPYEVLDAILELYLEKGQGVEEIVAQGFAASIVQDIVARIRVNEYKRKQAPLGLKVTSKAFGSGRRYPITQKYRG